MPFATFISEVDRSEKMNVLINMTNLLICEALGELLRREKEGYGVVVTNNIADTEKFLPDVIIVDAQTLSRELAEIWPQAKVILLDTGLGEEEIVTLLLNFQLDGIIKPNSNLQMFKKALKSVGDGQIWIDNKRIKAILKHAESLASSKPEANLSKKEKEIIILIAQGQKNREIAGNLCISEQTVKSHISRIFRKKNINCRSQLVPLAMKLKLPALE
jgi:LuxR family transcriptional regulator, positive regulator of biofilm formation